MSEYWVSHKKYFCKYCDIYISDDAPSRQQHENGLRHKGNTDRFIRGLYKAGEKRKKDLDEEKRDMARIEQAAQASFAQDVGAGRARASSSKLAPSASASASPRRPYQKPSNPYANYTTAESLGLKDPDADRLLAEAQRRQTQGVAGDWEIITQTPAPNSTSIVSIVEDEEMSRKREAEAVHDDDRHFKLRKKTVMAGLGEIYDPGIIPIKLKKEERTVIDNPAPAAIHSDVTAPKWTTLHWKRSGDDDEKETKEDADGDAQFGQEVEDALQTSSEQQSALCQASTEDKKSVKAEETLPRSSASVSEEAGNLFRKRKTLGTSGRGRRHI